MLRGSPTSWPAVVLLSMVALAGCVDGDDPAPGAGGSDVCAATSADPEGVRYVDPTHDPIATLDPDLRWDHELRNVRTCSLPAIGRNVLNPTGEPHRYIGEIDMRGDLGLGAVAVLGNGEAPRVYILDISDRAHPEVVSWIDQVNTYIVDVKFSQDGALLFTASQSLPTDPELVGSPELTGPTGFTVYDVSDPAQPTYLATEPDPQFGCHMMYHRAINDREWLFCVSQHLRAYEIVRQAGQAAVGMFVDYVPPSGPAANPIVGDPTGLLAQGPHDLTVTEDAATGRVYAAVSHWGEGMRLLDVTDMPLIQEVGAWTGEGATHYGGNVHTAMMFTVGVHRYVVASPEYTAPGNVPSLWVLDVDDVTAPRLVAEWFHPGEYDSQGLFLTTHQWQVAPTGPDVTPDQVRFYLTYNHAGVWVLDFQKILDNDHAGAVLGFNLARAEVDPDAAVANAVLNTWDVNVVDGHIYGSDRATGLWVFHYAGDRLGDTRVTGFA